jgi:hypothetical protein
VGQPLDRLRGNLTRLAEATDRPLAVFLQEATRGDDWTIPGYEAYSGPHSGDGDSNRILVRKGAEVLDSGHVRVPGDGWEWNGRKRTMRVFVWVAVRHEGKVHVLVCVHRIPNGPRPALPVNREAWNAEHRALVSLVADLGARWPDAAITLGGDWNAGMGEDPSYPFSLRALADDIGAGDVAVLGIDGFMTVNGRIRRVEKLDDKHGSDGHRPVVGTVVA